MRRALAALLALSLAGCALQARTRTAVEAQGRRLDRSVCVLFCDGLSAEVFRKLLSEGVLPSIDAEIVKRGLSFDVAVASVPSETYPNLGALLTGLFPGHHGIPANVWLDRRLRLREAHTNIFRTYSSSDFLVPQARTLFERLPSGSVAITTPVSKGATVSAKNLATVMAAYVRNDWTLLDRKTLDDMGDAYAGADSAHGLPPLVWGHLLGPDEVAHFDGQHSAEMRRTFAAIDSSFARLVRRLKRRGLYEKVLFVLLGDHGNGDYESAVSAEELVHRALFEHPTASDCVKLHCRLVPKPTGAYDVGEAEIAVGAYRGAMIWLPSTRPPEDVPAAFRTRRKGPRKGAKPPTKLKAMPARSAFAATLARMSQLELVLTRGDEEGRVVVYGLPGRSEIWREGAEDGTWQYGYRVLDGNDPLGYPASLNGLTAGASEWLRQTAHTEYPDMVVQLAEFFDSPRSPDVYISPRRGIGFREARAAGHGGLSRDETVVPLVFAGPGVSAGRREVARTVDLAPTLLAYLGVPYDESELDGEDLGIATSHDPGGSRERHVPAQGARYPGRAGDEERGAAGTGR